MIRGRSAILWVVGPDAVSFLQGIVTQDVAAMASGDVAYSLLLEPRGKLTDAFWLLRGDDRVGVVTGRERVEHTEEALARWRIRVKAEFDIDSREIVELWGAGSSDTVAANAIAVPEGWADLDGMLVARVPLGTLPRIVIAGATADLDGTVPVGRVAATAVRIEAGAAEVGVDIDDRTIPQETGLVEEAVSFTKGCYLGQELVARIDTRGHVNRHLRGVVVGVNVIPPIGARVHAGDREVGTLTSVAESLEVRAPVGLALVRREVEPGAEVIVRWDGGEAPATVHALPLTTF